AQPSEAVLPSQTDGSHNVGSEDTQQNAESMNKGQLQKKQNKPRNTDNSFCCSMCDKKFSTDAGRLDHARVKHKVGEQIDLDSLTLKDDLKCHSELKEFESQPNLDLITFDHGSDGCDTSQSSLPATITETGSLIQFDDDDNSAGDSFNT
ncbi:unnamed protein product, partial [Rotaria sp. Silwood1]